MVNVQVCVSYWVFHGHLWLPIFRVLHFYISFINANGSFSRLFLIIPFTQFLPRTMDRSSLPPKPPYTSFWRTWTMRSRCSPSVNRKLCWRESRLGPKWHRWTLSTRMERIPTMRWAMKEPVCTVRLHHLCTYGQFEGVEMFFTIFGCLLLFFWSFLVRLG